MKKGPAITESYLSALFQPKSYPQSLPEDTNVSRCMMEWHTVLEMNYYSYKGKEVSMRRLAILGATGRIFEALLYSENKLGKKILPFQVLSGIRSTLYHAPRVFAQLNTRKHNNLTPFFGYLYEYCRTELHKIHGEEFYPPLLFASVEPAEREKPYFNETITHAIEIGQTRQVKDKESLQVALRKNVTLLNNILTYFKKYVGCFVNDDTSSSLYQANVVRASIVGAVAGWISLDAIHLQRLTKEKRLEEKPVIKLGKQYRHQWLTIGKIVIQQQIVACTSAQLVQQLRGAIAKADLKEVKVLLQKWKAHPSVRKSDLSEDSTVGECLIAAAKNGSLPIVKYLYDHCSRNTWRAFAFAVAAEQGHEIIVKWYLQYKTVSPDLLQYATILATENHQQEMIELLTEKPDGMNDLINRLEELLISSSEEEAEETGEAIARQGALIISTPVPTRSSSSMTERASNNKNLTFAKRM
ncbi:ankyrin repeat domain-containing protein [Candidatus Berkiella aquae]|uniref:Ankyrin repeat domain-containing protein n=1 Tax=Candidatus Berkiella aquae TaxID=295108 RepID=A0A0Q9YME8_9GAMM|nr:ankyrin repeat domain-containing protein [Candidatus Berkiella aquae]MCS5710382.1 ankyrin repeat domain-containing protein [Candidatus Berkiella aquae]